MNNIFLGYPSLKVKQFIEKYYTPLCFEAVDSGAVIQLKCNGNNLTTQVFQVSTDKINWTDHTFNSAGMLINDETSEKPTEFILANVGDKVYFKAKVDNTNIARDFSNYLQFTTTQAATAKKVKVSGNVMSLLAPKFGQMRSVGEYCFYSLFYNCKSIYDCNSLTLPATQLADSCYSYMFYGCSSLRVAPQLPATQLFSYCYFYMFQGCSNLTAAPQLPATQLADSCYSYMFYNCSKLTTASALPAIQLADSCYYFMFYGCSSLQAAPQLPATQLADSCYSNMFQNCTSLSAAPQLPATQLARYCYSNMFYNCSSLRVAPQLPATQLADSCYSNMFFNCTSLQAAPQLPATQLANYCYSDMFLSCSKFTDCHMKESMSTVYNKSLHGDTIKTVKFDLPD